MDIEARKIMWGARIIKREIAAKASCDPACTPIIPVCRSSLSLPSMHRSCIALATVVACAATRPASSQQTVDRVSSPVAFRAVARDSLISGSIRGDLAAIAATPAPVIVGSRWRVLVSFAPVVPLFASSARVADLLGRCSAQFPEETSPGEFAAQHDPWAAYDSVTADRPLVVFSIVKNGGPGAACGEKIVDEPAIVARGLEFLPSAYVAEQSPTDASFGLGTRHIAPAYVDRVPVLRVVNGKMERDSSAQLRLYVPLDDLRPDSAGRFAPGQVRIQTTAIWVDTVTIPENVLRQVWLQSLPWRLARAGIQDSGARAAVATMSARDARVRRDSRVRVATALWTARDTVGSAVVAAQLLEADPCLASSPVAGAAIKMAMDRVRPSAMCTTRSPVSVLARGISFPGMGQRAIGGHGRAVGIATAVALVASGAAALKSRQAYSKYKAATTTTDAGALFNSATNSRSMAQAFGVTGATLWGSSAIYATWKQWRRNKSIEAVSSYGGAR
jgi:hypothetical protein